MRSALAVMAVALSCAAAPAGAQSYPSGGAYPPAGGYGGRYPPTSPAYNTQRDEDDDRAAPPRAGYAPQAEEAAPSQDLVRELNLRADQRAAFADYQAAFRTQGEDEDEAAEARRLAALTTPQRLDDAARQMDRDRADFERVAAATRRFYATLDAEQRRAFDRITAPQPESDDEGSGGPPANPGYASPPPR